MYIYNSITYESDIQFIDSRLSFRMNRVLNATIETLNSDSVIDLYEFDLDYVKKILPEEKYYEFLDLYLTYDGHCYWESYMTNYLMSSNFDRLAYNWNWERLTRDQYAAIKNHPLDIVPYFVKSGLNIVTYSYWAQYSSMGDRFCGRRGCHTPKGIVMKYFSKVKLCEGLRLVPDVLLNRKKFWCSYCPRSALFQLSAANS